MNYKALLNQIKNQGLLWPYQDKYSLFLLKEVKFNGIFNNKNPDSPAPSSYLVNSKYITPKYSIGKRFSFNMNKWIQQVPGPGNYNHEQPTGNLKSSISNFMSPPSTKFPKT